MNALPILFCCGLLLAGQHADIPAPSKQSEARKSKILKPDSAGVILLHARDVTVHGKTVRYEPEPHKNTIGYWTKVEDWVSWNFEVTMPGNYKVVLLQGCGPKSGGSLVEFKAAGQSLEMTVKETKHFQDFVEREIGAFKFEKAGTYTLEVRPKTKPGLAVMDLRQVKLVPENSL